jgi:hypothetical protein
MHRIWPAIAKCPSRGRERSSEEGEMGRGCQWKPWASSDLHLPPSFPLCPAAVLPGGSGEPHLRRPDDPHPLLYFP